MVLVTGATGILGSHVVYSLLNRGKKVVAARRSGSSTSDIERLFGYYGATDLLRQIEWRDPDLSDAFSIEGALEGVEEVFHCAGFVSFNPRDKKELMLHNEVATRNIVNACLFKGVKALCFSSSLATIRNPDATGELNESVFWKASGRESDYAISKHNAEREVWRGIEEGLPAVIVNPGVLLSPGFWTRSSSRLFPRCHKGNKFYSSGTTGYIGAADAAEVMVELMERKRYGERYILIEGNYGYKEVFSKIQGCMNIPPPRFRVRKWQLKAGQKALAALAFFTGKEPEITRPVVDSLLNRRTYSNQKLLAEGGFKLTPVPDVISEICRIYLSERSNGAGSGR